MAVGIQQKSAPSKFEPRVTLGVSLAVVCEMGMFFFFSLHDPFYPRHTHMYQIVDPGPSVHFGRYQKKYTLRFWCGESYQHPNQQDKLIVYFLVTTDPD